MIAPTLDCGCGGGVTCSECSLDDLSDVEAAAPDDGNVLTWVEADGAWEAVAPSGGGGGVKDFAEAVVTGGNGTVPTGGAAAISNLASLVLDAAVGDLIEVAFISINFGPQTFFSVRLLGGATPRSKGYPGWYYTSNIGGQGGWTFSPFKFLVVADDISAGTITLQMQGDAQGGTGTVLEGAFFQATNFGPVGA